MNIVIAGLGKFGKELTENLSKEKHNITVIDNKASVVEDIINRYDVMGIVGNAASYDIQRDANVAKADLFIAGVGTGGTVMGIGKYLREKNNHIKIYPLEPSNSPTISTGKHNTTHHRIQGISDEFIPPILDLSKLNDVIGVDDGDSIIMAQMICKKFGLGIGISSGANFIGAVKALELNNFKGNIVTVFSDDNKKYLSTDLMNNEPVKDGFISSDIELIDLKVL